MRPRLKKSLKKPQKIGPNIEGKISPSIMEFTHKFEININILQQSLINCSDVVFRFLNIAEHRACLIYSQGMVNNDFLTKNILKRCFSIDKGYTEDLLAYLEEESLAVGGISRGREIRKCIEEILSGKALLLIEDYQEALLLNIPGWEKRSVTTPEVESSIRGPKESFTETLEVNSSLLRRRLATPDLKMVDVVLGQKSRTNLRVCYLEAVAHPKLLDEVMRRLNLVNIDGLLDTSSLEELINDEPYSPFPTIQTTERPDKAVASILEGRIVIIQENTPFALILPVVFAQFFQAVDDYYYQFHFGTFLRSVRLLAVFTTLYLPALYVAVTTFHQEMIPTPLLISLQNQKEGVPFPALVEAILMGIAFEILREGGIRLPSPVGQAVSIVGALIIGEAAVTAGLIGPAMVIVTAATAITSFTVPSPAMSEALLLLRVVLVLVSGALGLWGILVVTLLLLGHLAAMRSFGVPYLSPLGPLVLADLDDHLLRAPLWLMEKRPKLIARDLIRMGKRPSPVGKSQDGGGNT